MNSLGDWQVEVCPLHVTVLLVRRDGIVDDSLDARGGEVPLQRIAARASHDKEVPDARGPREDGGREP